MPFNESELSGRKMPHLCLSKSACILEDFALSTSWAWRLISPSVRLRADFGQRTSSCWNVTLLSGCTLSAIIPTRRSLLSSCSLQVSVHLRSAVDTPYKDMARKHRASWKAKTSLKKFTPMTCLAGCTGWFNRSTVIIIDAGQMDNRYIRRT